MASSSKRPSALDPPREIAGGKYRLLRLIGSGGMGEVYEAENSDTQKRVAIKCISGHVAARRDAIDRLAQEARGSGLVRHPNVVDVYDLIREDGAAYLVMEYLEGESFAEALKRGDLSPCRIVQIMLAAMRGAAEAHRKGVIHRDIKPDNIFLARVNDTPLPVPKVLDFGICKLRAVQPTDLSLTRSGHLMGTPLYMSIEQLEGRADIDGRVDVYAFGVTLYFALTGAMPYQGNTLPELIVNITTSRPSPPDVLCAAIPKTLGQLILWAIEQKRERRLDSLDAFVCELEPFVTERGFQREFEASEDDPSAVSSASTPWARHRSAAFPTGHEALTPRASVTVVRARRLRFATFAAALVASISLSLWAFRTRTLDASVPLPSPAKSVHDAHLETGPSSSESAASPGQPSSLDAPIAPPPTALKESARLGAQEASRRTPARSRRDSRLERAPVPTASGLITVSEPFSDSGALSSGTAHSQPVDAAIGLGSSPSGHTPARGRLMHVEQF
jgi:serine/threonine protein kinase